MRLIKKSCSLNQKLEWKCIKRCAHAVLARDDERHLNSTRMMLSREYVGRVNFVAVNEDYTYTYFPLNQKICV